jgi:branched-chain amino acid transport system permease protein
MALRPKTLLVLALGVCLFVSQFSGRINPYFLDVTIGVGINIILAVSLNLVNGYTGQFSLGHAGFMAVGAYISAVFTMFIGPKMLPVGTGLFETTMAYGWFLLSLVFGGLFAAVAGLGVGIPSLRLKGDYLAIVTLGFGEIIRVIFRNTDTTAIAIREWLAEPGKGMLAPLKAYFDHAHWAKEALNIMEGLGGALGLNGIPGQTNLFWTFSWALVTIYTVMAMVHSTYGRGFIAVHDDEVAAEAMGLNTTRYKIIAFVVGAFFAGVAGGLYGHFKLSIDPKGFDFMKSIEIVVMVILGGMGNTTGVVVAAILLTLLPEFLRKFADYRMIMYSVLLIVLMLARPQGLFTWKRKAKTG